MQSQQNQQRVNFRQAENVLKEQLRAEKAMIVLHEEQQKAERLDKLRAQVSCCIHAQNVAASVMLCMPLQHADDGDHHQRITYTTFVLATQAVGLQFLSFDMTSTPVNMQRRSHTCRCKCM